ncbi:MAG: hypothetical protein ACI4U2_02895 [Christensenellaceae bacterium]
MRKTPQPTTVGISREISRRGGINEAINKRIAFAEEEEVALIESENGRGEARDRPLRAVEAKERREVTREFVRSGKRADRFRLTESVAKNEKM